MFCLDWFEFHNKRQLYLCHGIEVHSGAKLVWNGKEKGYVWLLNILVFFILKVQKIGSEVWAIKQDVTIPLHIFMCRV